MLNGDDVDVRLPAAYDGVSERRLCRVRDDDRAARARVIAARSLLRLVTPRPRLYRHPQRNDKKHAGTRRRARDRTVRGRCFEIGDEELRTATTIVSLLFCAHLRIQ